MKTLLLFFTTFASFTALAHSLECYSCFPNKAQGKTCEDISQAVPKVCQGGEQFCLKIALDNEVTRDCFLDPLGKKEATCRSRGSNVECYCQGNYCNHAGQLAPASHLFTWILPVTLFSYLVLGH